MSIVNEGVNNPSVCILQRRKERKKERKKAEERP